VRLLPILAATVLLVAGCSGAPAADTPPAPTPSAPSLATAERTGEKYVALGDSFTSGPLVPTTDLAGGCFRSDHNYPSLLAKRLDIEDFVDVSCAGARTRDLSRRQVTLQQRGHVPPQLDALDADTTLVTVGIGGNDFDLYSHLTTTCRSLRQSDPGGSPCRATMTSGGRDLLGVTARIGRRVERALEQVARRAPHARVVLVGYPRVAPSRGECPDRLPYATGDVPFGDEVLHRLTTAMHRAADRAGAEFLDMYAASRGHDVCSDTPYVNGVVTDQQRAAAFHPFRRGMNAVARDLATLLAS
jgi:lysophospholipase L1-like esterase